MTTAIINSEEYLDLSFKIGGAPIPLDNGYIIYSALCRICPPLHDLNTVGIHPIAGIPTSNNYLKLTHQSHLKIRIHHQQIPLIYPYLTGQTFEIGQESYQLNIPDYQPLISSESLYSRLVVIKGYQDATTFQEAVKRQLDSLKVEGNIELLTRYNGTRQRRQLTITKRDKRLKIREFGV